MIKQATFLLTVMLFCAIFELVLVIDWFGGWMVGLLGIIATSAPQLGSGLGVELGNKKRQTFW